MRKAMDYLPVTLRNKTYTKALYSRFKLAFYRDNLKPSSPPFFFLMDPAVSQLIIILGGVAWGKGSQD